MDLVYPATSLYLSYTNRYTDCVRPEEGSLYRPFYAVRNKSLSRYIFVRIRRSSGTEAEVPEVETCSLPVKVVNGMWTKVRPNSERGTCHHLGVWTLQQLTTRENLWSADRSQALNLSLKLKERSGLFTSSHSTLPNAVDEIQLQHCPCTWKESKLCWHPFESSKFWANDNGLHLRRRGKSLR